MSTTLRTQITRLEITALVFRGLAVGWSVLTVLTFGFLSTTGEFIESRPLFISGTVLAFFFLIVLSWPVRPDVRAHLPRVILGLQWQLATGVLIAFTLGFVVREELRMGFWLLGSYLVVPGVFLMLIRLTELGLSKRYATIDDLAKEAEQGLQVRKIAAATADHVSAARVGGERIGFLHWFSR